MVANTELAKVRGISDEGVEAIDSIHEIIDCIIALADRNDDRETRLRAFDNVENLEYELQKLWGFDQNNVYHTWGQRLFKRYRELDYVDSVYRCNQSGERRTIKLQDVEKGGVVTVGEGFIDFGSVVRRVGNIEKVF